MAQVKRQIRFISELGYNAMTFYIENVVRPHSHPDFAPREGFFTMKQLDEICAYGRKFGVDIIGGFQSFGHMEKLLSLDAYSSLGATVNMIDACNPEAQAFLSDVIGELCEHSSSPFFCTYCDETFDLGKGKSANRVSEVGVAQYYADHINFLREVVSSHGKQLLICGDMILKYPAIMEMIPDDVIILTWNYDSPASFAKWIEPFKNAGKTFWVSPGVHACSRMLPDIRVAEGNRRFIDEGIAAGSEGCMVFTWDESTFHSVKLLNYNIAKFAYNMLGKSSENFDVEYERKRFGAINGATSLYKEMMHLMDIPMFSNLNDRIFYQRFTPLPGEPLVIDSRQLAKADSLICVLEQHMKEVKAKTRSGKDELQAWNNMLRSYRFMVDARLAMKEITPAKCDALIKQVNRLEKDFKGWWLKENQRHSYKEGIQSFEDKKQELRTLKANLIAGEDLKVLDRQNSYMCFWLTTTVSADETVDIGSLPTPGLVFKSASGEHRWTKTESMNGLGMDYNSFYGNPQVGSQVWSYAVLNAEEDTDLSLLFGYVGSADIFLNGECIFKGEESNTLTPDRFSVDCRLCKGANHLFVRLSKDFPEFGFSIYPQGGSITSRKHKYAVR